MLNKNLKYPPLVLMLSGKAQSGKDLVAKMIRNILEDGISRDEYFFASKVATLGFADILKSISKRNHGYKNKKDDREILLQIGDLMRDIDPDVFVKPIVHFIDIYREMGYETIVITDTRFENEYDYINRYSRGIPYLIRITNPLGYTLKDEVVNNHQSEQLDFPYDYELVLEDISTTDGHYKMYKKLENMLINITSDFMLHLS